MLGLLGQNVKNNNNNESKNVYPTKSSEFFHECFQGPIVNFFVNVIKYCCPYVDLSQLLFFFLKLISILLVTQRNTTQKFS